MSPTVVQMDMTVNLSSFSGDILKALADHLNKALSSGYEQAVKARMSSQLESRFRLTPQYQAIVGDRQIRGELGLVNPTAALESVLQSLIAGTQFVIHTPRSTGSDITGGADIGISRSDFADALASPLSRFQSGPHNVDWLRWMLLEGENVVVPGFRFSVTGNRGSYSRTGVGIMIPGNRDGGWRVPADRGIAGTAADNWITQVMTGFQDVMFPILFEELQRRI